VEKRKRGGVQIGKLREALNPKVAACGKRRGGKEGFVLVECPEQQLRDGLATDAGQYSQKSKQHEGGGSNRKGKGGSGGFALITAQSVDHQRCVVHSGGSCLRVAVVPCPLRLRLTDQCRGRGWLLPTTAENGKQKCKLRLSAAATMR
jgi:hypothetical protein